MRNNCPVCGSSNRIQEWKMKYLVPDGWEMPENNKICLCKDCDLIYYDNDKEQKDYDEYYKNRYGFDGALTCGESVKRLEGIADKISRLYPDKKSCIVDWGGGIGVIKSTLEKLDYNNVHTVNPGDNLPKNIDIVIASQVFEHLYDIHGNMKKLIKNMKENGRFFIEIPDAKAMLNAKDLPMLDFHQKHTNHFSSHTLDKLLSMYGYRPIQSYHSFEKYHFGFIYGAIYEKFDPLSLYRECKYHIDNSINEKIEKLKKINYPVVIWGLGDIALHLLSFVNLEIDQLVDKDPAYRNQTISGIPVDEFVTKSSPIVIMAVNQCTSILKDIEDKKLNNKIIII